MAAGRYDFVIEQGTTFSKQITWKDSSGVAINLTGYTITGKIKRKPSDITALASFTCTLANQGSSPGVFTIALTATQTAALPTSKDVSRDKESVACVYDIKAQNGSTVYRLIEGVVNISPGVS